MLLTPPPSLVRRHRPAFIHNHRDFSTTYAARLENQHTRIPRLVAPLPPVHHSAPTILPNSLYYSLLLPRPPRSLRVTCAPRSTRLFTRAPRHRLTLLSLLLRTEHAVGNVVEGSRHAPRHADAVGAEYAEHQQRHGEEDDVGVQARPGSRDVATKPDQPRQKNQP